MPGGPPPPRWRVVERGRRLEVIDNWADGRTTGVVPAASHGTARQPASSGSSPWGAATDSTPAFRALARLVTFGAIDAEGRPLLTTAAWYDRKAPRTFALDDPATQRLGRAIVVALLALAGLAAVLGWFALGVPLIAWAIVSQQGKTLTTRWLDGLAP